MRRLFLRGSAFFFALLVASGCQSGANDDIPPPTSRDKAAAVLISADVAAPWDEIAGAMQPRFALASGDAALTKGVIPATAQIQEQVLSAFNLSGAIRGPGSSSPSSQASGGSPAALPPIQKPSEAIGVDPVLQYQAALALFQEVQLMNAQIQSIARDQNYVPYLVQLRLTVMPYRRQLTYDLHARISFFVDRAAGSDSPNATRQMLDCITSAGKMESTPTVPRIIPLLATDDLERALISEAAETARQIGFGLATAIHGVGAQAQMTKTDEAIHSAEGQDINSLFTVGRLSDNTIYVRIGASNQISGKKDFSLVGKNYDVSVILLVPLEYFECLKMEEHKLNAERIEARAITLLPAVDIVGDSRFNEVSTGKRLVYRPRSVLADQVGEKIENFLGYTNPIVRAWNDTPEDKREKIAQDLLFGVEDNDIVEFEHTLKTICVPPAATESTKRGLYISDENKTCPTSSIAKSFGDPDFIMGFWNAISGALGDFTALQATLTLPRPKPVIVPRQTALLIDDGKTGSQVELSNVTGPADHLLTAVLHLKGAGPNAPTYPFAAQAMKLNPNTSVLTISFASPAKLGLTKVDPASRLELRYRGSSPCDPRNRRVVTDLFCQQGALQVNGHDNNFKVVALHALTAEATKPGLSFTAKTDTVVADHGKATLTVTIDKLKDASAKITVAGAQYSGAVDRSGKTLAGPNEDIVVSRNTVITYMLQNLSTGSAFTITAEGRDSAGKSTGSLALKFAVAK